MKKIEEELLKFRDERNWAQFHNAKDLAISLSLEASELLENFQWKSSEEAISNKKNEIEEEIADVASYLILLAHELEIDIESAIYKKIKKNATKYPIDKAYGNNKKYSEL